jgi:hypothetical protein
MSPNLKIPSDDLYDDLTAIKGIKQARQQWFRDTFKVRTFGDLAALTVDEIETRLKAEKQIPSRSNIEVWVAEAKRLAENPALAAATKANLHSSEDGWKPFASFIVEFQEKEGLVERRTHVHHMESDQNHNWLGISQQDLSAWMMQQLGDRVVVVTVTAETPLSVSVPVEIPTTPIEPIALPQRNQGTFSTQLQQVLAKAAHASQPDDPARIPAAPISMQVPREYASNAEPRAEITTVTPVSTLAEKPKSGYSDKLQKILMKAQELSSK